MGEIDEATIREYSAYIVCLSFLCVALGGDRNTMTILQFNILSFS